MVKVKRVALGFDPRTEFLTNPHDKYARFILKMRRVIIAMLQEFAPPEIVASLDFSTLEVTSESFLDDQLKEHFADICYTVQLKGARKFKITLLIEHKSTAYQGSVLFQLIRYISNIQHEHERQGLDTPLVLPIVLYHGETAMTYETPKTLFPDVPEFLLAFVPTFRYLHERRGFGH